METLLQQAIKASASDIFLMGGAVPVMRVDGALQPMGKKSLSGSEIESYFSKQLSKSQSEEFSKNLDLDFRMEVKGVSLRTNMHQQKNGLAVAIRIIPPTIPTVQELGLSETIQSITDLRDGLVLVTGPTGSGKSTTIASLLQKINTERSEHIITIEDPVEFLFENDKSYFEQREVKVDTPSFESALKHILRQNPDIIFVGEMRDAESVGTALTAAETGHLVVSTLHTPTAADTIERIIDIFPPEKQRQILIQLASVLRVVVSQRLLPKMEGGLVAAHEVMINNPAIANLIRNNNIAQINSAIQTGRKEGMIAMKMAVQELIKAKVLDPKFTE